MRTVLVALLLSFAATQRIIIKVSRTVLFVGDSIEVVCSVPRHEDNRKVEAVLEGYTSSEHQLNGEDAAVTHRFSFKKVPCDVSAAVCRLTDKYNNQITTLQQLQISGCDQP